MQEEVEHRSVALAISTGKLTLRVLRDVARKYLDAQRRKQRTKDVIPHGKQTVKQLVGQGKGVTSAEINTDHLKPFERIAKKYGVDYAIRKDASQSPPKYVIFFKAPDSDALTAVFSEFTRKSVQDRDKSSLMQKIREYRQRTQTKTPTVEKHRAKEQSR